MKHIKKRAILSAVAMLLVSAIALSSATFAWFSAGTAVSVSNVQATVANNDGSLLISADNTIWKTTITETDLRAVGTNIFPAIVAPATAAALKPVSVTMSSSGSKVVAGSITSQVFTALAGQATDGYIKYKVYLKTTSTTGMDVTITPTFNTAAAFVYAGLEVAGGTPTTRLLTGLAVDNYFPINTFGMTATDTNNNDIIDASETLAANLGTQQAAANVGPVALHLAYNTATPFYVYIWAEGQDSDCSGAVVTTSATLALSIEKV